MNEALMPLTT